MAKKIPIEIKAALLKYYYAEECSIQSLVKYALAKYDIDITRHVFQHALIFKIHNAVSKLIEMFRSQYWVPEVGNMF